MSIDVTCQCGKRLGVPEAYAGKAIRCPACKAPVVVPAEVDRPPLDDDIDEDLASVVKRAAPKPPATQPPASPVPSAPSPAGMPVEPWYYGFLDGFAKLIMIGGLIVCALGAITGLAFAFGSPNEAGTNSGVALGVVTLAWSLCGVFPVLLTSAPILLAVDVARNVRATRYRP